jgi:PAS domain S-box-containing protein
LGQYCSERRVIDDVVLCIEEAATNAIRHSGVEQDIDISLQFDSDRLVAVLKDRGQGFEVANFDPQRSPDPTLDHGRGLFIIAALMDTLELRLNGGLEVHMTRRAQPRGGPAPLESGLAPKDARTRAMLEEIDEAFLALDWQYRHVYVNELAVRFTNRSRDELLGRSPWEIDSLLQDSSLAEHFREAMELGRPSVFEHRSIASDDWLEARVYPTSTGISVYLREINERKRIEQEVVATRAELAVTLAAITDGFYTLDRAWRVTYLNDQAAAVFPGGREALGADFWELFPGDVGSAFEANKRRAMEQGEVCSFEFYYPPFDTWFEERDYPSADGITVLFTDISERKRAEAALLESGEAARRAEERYRNLFTTMIEGFCIIEMIFDDVGKSVDYRFLEINPAFEERTGLHGAQGKLMRELAPDHEQHWFDIYGKVAVTGEPARFMAPADALGRYYDVSAFRVGEPQSRQVAIVFDDITERHRAEQDNQRLLEESQAQSEELQTQTEELQIQGDALQAQNAELVAQRDELVRESELRAGLNALALLLHSTLKPDEVMRLALAEATRALGIDAAAIELPEDDNWLVRFAAGLPGEVLGSPLIGEPVISRLVAYSGEVLVLDQVADNETVGPFATRHDVRSLIAVPLMAQGQVVGALILADGMRRPASHGVP